MTTKFDLIVVGTGVAGLTAAGFARRVGLTTAMIESHLFGGLIINVNDLDGPVQGAGSDYAAGLMAAACDLGAENIQATATAIQPNHSGLTVATDAGIYSARAVIVASGAAIRYLGIPGESELEGRGVSRCADCDGPVFSGRDVIVVGGGDSAVQEALVLAAYASKVHIIHRGESFRARAQLVERLAPLRNVVIHWRTRVDAIIGSDTVRALAVVGPDGSSEIPCAGVFPYVGLEPTCAFVPAAATRDENGYLMADDSMRTVVPGLFAAGVVRSGNGGNITDAEADAAIAVRSAFALLNT